MTGTDIQHIPYKGTALAIPDIINGQIALMFDNIVSVMPHIRSGKVKALAISSPQRSPLVPDVPTVAESGLPGFESVTWFGLLAPANAPRAVVERINAEVNKALQTQEVKDRFVMLGFERAGGSPADFAAVILKDATKWSKVIKDANVRPE